MEKTVYVYVSTHGNIETVEENPANIQGFGIPIQKTFRLPEGITSFTKVDAVPDGLLVYISNQILFMIYITILSHLKTNDFTNIETNDFTNIDRLIDTIKGQFLFSYKKIQIKKEDSYIKNYEDHFMKKYEYDSTNNLITQKYFTIDPEDSVDSTGLNNITTIHKNTRGEFIETILKAPKDLESLLIYLKKKGFTKIVMIDMSCSDSLEILSPRNKRRITGKSTRSKRSSSNSRKKRK